MAVLSRDILSGETFWLTIIDDISWSSQRLEVFDKSRETSNTEIATKTTMKFTRKFQFLRIWVQQIGSSQLTHLLHIDTYLS